MNGGSGSQGREWLGDAVRLSFFVADGRSWPSGLLERLVGQPAELEQTSKRGNAVTSLEALKLGGHQVNVVAQPLRLDVHVSVALLPDEQEANVRATAFFRDLIHEIAKNGSALAPFVRLAATASLIKPYATKTDVYRSLQNRFPCLALSPENSDDFVLQMNHFLRNDDVRINCVERWSHGIFERIDIPIMGMTTPVRVAKRIEGVKLDLDFNTHPDEKLTFDVDRSKRIGARLVDAMYDKIKTEE
jgi:hypothetical protein